MIGVNYNNYQLFGDYSIFEYEFYHEQLSEKRK